jgi:hypothetical protein
MRRRRSSTSASHRPPYAPTTRRRNAITVSEYTLVWWLNWLTCNTSKSISFAPVSA